MAVPDRFEVKVVGLSFRPGYPDNVTALPQQQPDPREQDAAQLALYDADVALQALGLALPADETEWVVSKHALAIVQQAVGMLRSTLEFDQLAQQADERLLDALARATEASTRGRS